MADLVSTETPTARFMKKEGDDSFSPRNTPADADGEEVSQILKSDASGRSTEEAW
jgi:hypothetical protein